MLEVWNTILILRTGTYVFFVKFSVKTCRLWLLACTVHVQLYNQDENDCLVDGWLEAERLADSWQEAGQEQGQSVHSFDDIFFTYHILFLEYQVPTYFNLIRQLVKILFILYG